MSTKKKLFNILAAGWLVVSVLISYTSFSAAIPKPAKAAEASAWDAGRIIDDGKFTDKNSMSAQDIQNFLNSKVPTCDTWHASGISGESPPWTCLKDYSENGKSAAQIIWEAAQSYTINPQVLLATLQKETGLVTDTWPYRWQYRTAMGFACPDNGSCDPAFYGFTNQVTQAARHFRNFFDNNPNWYVPFTPGVRFIQYNPNSGCGGSNVNIQNRATAALYSYTPYQPNAAAMANLYGTGDGCSAYGNRNFWRTFVDWFGSTRDDPYRAAFAGQSGYPILSPGQSAPAWMQFKNVGTLPWYGDNSVGTAGPGVSPVHLATSKPINRGSQFSSTWAGGNRDRPALNFAAVYEADGVTLAPDQNIAQVGQIAKFSFTFTASPTQGSGTFAENFNPVAEGSPYVFNDVGAFLNVSVREGYKLSFAGQSGYPTMLPGQSQTEFIKYKNEGAASWYDDTALGSAPAGTKPVHLSTANPINRSSQFGYAWAGGNRDRPALNFTAVYEADGVTLADNQHVVQTGQVAKFNITFTTPLGTTPGVYGERFLPVLEGAGPFNDIGTFLNVTVQTPTYSQSFAGQSIYPTIKRGNSFTGFVNYKNTGNMPWYDDASVGSGPAGSKPVHLATASPINRSSIFGNTWAGGNRDRPATTFAAVYEADGSTLAADQHVVQPGQIAKFNIPFTTSGSTPLGTFREKFQAIVEGGATMNDIGAFLDVTVTP
ncbi:hypothetical protein HYX70_04025 [Candidatus Saccharibacteria bacterium]|nr:hypothetical protein [Candidatus Saccharibacteria bacterium]